MLSFVWPPGEPMVAGTGGSETYTAGHARELMRRGVGVQIVTIGHGLNDGRQDFTDLPFIALNNASEISTLPGTVMFINKAYDAPTKHKAAIILHCSIPNIADKEKYQAYVKDKTIIATSIYSGQQWALFLGVPYSRISIVLPFADPLFSHTKRSKPSKNIRILFAGRLHPEKGIYTILEMMHQKDMQDNSYSVNLVTAGQHVEIGREIARMLKGYPYAKLIPAIKSVPSMAELLAKSDILLMPSVYAEPFGMLSVEAQHTGCRVVASNVGGLPETNCGLLTLVKPRSPLALIKGIKQAVALGPATKRERDKAAEAFTLNQSVSELLKVLPLYAI